MRQSIIREFDSLYCNYPDKVAVIDGKEKITFGQLAAKANDLGNILLDRLEDTYSKPIGVFLPKCINAVVADMAISYSSNIFMNLDVKLPQARLGNIIRLIEPVLLISDTRYRSQLEGTGVPVLYMDEMQLDGSIRQEKHQRIMTHLDYQIDTDPFCIINTSGSTGTPKGVVLNHRSFFDFYDWAVETFQFNGSEIIGSLSPYVFDIYDFELCMMLLLGSTIVILDANLAIFPARLLQMAADNHVNFIFWVPTIMVNIANKDLLSKIDLSCLKIVWFAGEVFPTKQFNYWKRHLPETMFVNLYGPIEITLDCTYYIAENEIDERKPIPIGYPCRNTNVLILNSENVRCQKGEIGELCVRGTSLAMGYYNNSEKTSAAFTQNPLNNAYPELIYRTGDLAYENEEGVIIFKGRKDSLIKHMGYRIELSEIEHIAVNTLKLVKNCCVVYNHKEKAITMVYENEEGKDALEIKKALADALPKYMVPTEYISLEILPRNTNGKIDRLALTEKVNQER